MNQPPIKTESKPIPVFLIAIMVIAISLVVVLHADPAQTIVGMLIGIVLLVVVIDGGNKRVLSRKLGSEVEKEIASGKVFEAGISGQALSLLRDGKRIEAIKAVRTESGGGLKESKEKIDEISLRMEMGQQVIASGMPIQSRQSSSEPLSGLDLDVPESVIALLRNGRQIEAIKELRKSSGLGLTEAKSIIDRLNGSI